MALLHNIVIKNITFSYRVWRSRDNTKSIKNQMSILVPHLKKYKETCNILLSKRSPFTFTLRTVFSGICASASRSSYYLLKTLSNQKLLAECQPIGNYTALSKDLVNYTMDIQQGIMPHKSTLMTHALTGNFYSSKEIYGYYRDITGQTNVTSIEANTDPRIFAELPTLNVFQKTFGEDILHIQANADKKTSNLIVAGTKQPNLDWTTTVKCHWNKLDLMGYKREKSIYNDQKLAGGMLEHSTSGSLGIAYYDSNAKPIVFMNKPLSLEDLIRHDLMNINGITAAIGQDGLQNYFDISEVKTYVKSLLENNSLSFEDRHFAYQKYIWSKFQVNPFYNRGLSLIFPERVLFDRNIEVDAFQKEFSILLGNKNYNLDKRGDCRTVCHAMVKAYEKTIDKQIMQKLQYLRYESPIEFNRKFIEDLSLLLKKNAFYT